MNVHAKVEMTRLDLRKSGVRDPSSVSSTSPRRYLLLLNGPAPGRLLALEDREVRVGRAPSNTYELPDDSVSRFHAAIVIDEQDHATLIDTGSTNGTYLNEQRIEPNRPEQLRDGDRIRLGGNLRLKFLQPDPIEERLHRELFDRAVRDDLTGLYKRDFFRDHFRLLVRRAQELGLGVGVMMLDVDHFKQVNDRFGHPVGDVVLRQIAKVLQANAREEDLLARYGGEEFVLAVIAPNLDLARHCGERIRAAVAKARTPQKNHDEPAYISVTMSIGLAYSSRPTTDDSDYERLIGLADEALYRAKANGRDRLVATPVPRNDDETLE